MEEFGLSRLMVVKQNITQEQTRKFIKFTPFLLYMLGRHHLLLSLFTVAILFVPYFQENTELTLVILIGVAIGSLMPDADSPDAAIFHEKVHIKGNLGKIINGLFAPLFSLFGRTTKYAIYKPAVFIFGKTFLKKYNIGEKHRGFLHSFIGIGISTIFTAIYLSIILLAIGFFNIWYFLSFMVAYSFGALMHLIEDSSTVTGTQFNYPFSNLMLKGGLVTRPDSAQKPDLFTGLLGFVVIALFFAMELGYVSYPNWLITTVSVLFLLLSWTIFLFLIAKVKFERGELKSYPNVKSLL